MFYTNSPEAGATLTIGNTATTEAAEALRRRFAPLGDPWRYGVDACREIEDVIGRIRDLKRTRKAVLLAHNYQRPEIFEVADHVGDSFELARHAADVDAEVIVFCGVGFMAETAKILNPGATVLLPDAGAGCTLADSVTGEALEARKAELKKTWPDLQVVTYVNTTAEVKAASDVCCTSANALRIVESLPSRHILFVPDRNLAAYVQKNTDKSIISWDGDCYVHHQITPEQIEQVRTQVPGIRVLAHPECREDVLKLADAVLSTSGMTRYAKQSDAKRFLVVTECGMSDRLMLEVPEKKFYKACKLCAYMKMITLEGTLESLETMTHEIILDEEIRLGARQALDRMLELGA
jgi:quinolinate synthase